VSSANDVHADDLHAFAAAVAHEIRTPLSAVAGEIELALRRDRSPAEYREALRRIAVGISELVEISGDLTLLSESVPPPSDPPVSARLDTILSAIQNRYVEREDVTISLDGVGSVRVAGAAERLRRAITLVVEHAIRQRKGPATVSLHSTSTAAGNPICLVVDARPTGFWPNSWSSLAEGCGRSSGPLRLRTATRILARDAGILRVACASEREIVQIELQRTV
jgi:signal transduction histidine kinase